MVHLPLIDWVLIVVYLLVVVAAGFWLGRGLKSTRDYFLGSRNLPWWSVSFSIVATETSALTFLGVPAIAYGGDLGFIQMVFGYVIGRLVLAAWVTPRYFRGEIYSPYALLADRFGEPARKTAASLFLVSGALAAGVRVYVTCIPVQLIFNFQDNQIVWAILLFVGLSLIYTYVGGIRAVVWTDAVQFVLFVIGGAFALVAAGSIVRESATASEVVAMLRDGGKLAWFSGVFSLAMPFNVWMGLIGGTVLAMSTHGADQLIVQRVLSCGNVKEGRKALVLSAAIILPLFLLFLCVGAALWLVYELQPLAMALPEVRPGVGKNDYVFPIFILTELPVGVRGALIVGVLSAAMSSVSSALSALASVSTMDLAAAETKKDDSRLLRRSKIATLGWAGVLVGIALLSQQTASVLTLAFSLSGLTAGAMLGGLLLAMFSKRGDGRAIVVAMVLSLAFMLVLHFGQTIFLKEWWTANVGSAIAWPWYTPIGLSVTLGVYGCLRHRFR